MNVKQIADALRALAAALEAEETAPPQPDPMRLLPLKEAAAIAATSVRRVRDAIRTGDLTAYGNQRDRSVRRGDLDAWNSSRRLRPIVGPDDADIERRMREIEARGPRAKKPPGPSTEALDAAIRRLGFVVRRPPDDSPLPFPGPKGFFGRGGRKRKK